MMRRAMIKANTYNPEFNIVIHAVFIKKIKIGRRLKNGIWTKGEKHGYKENTEYGRSYIIITDKYMGGDPRIM